MPTTSYQASTFAASVIGARTDSAGSGVVDLSAEEARISQFLLSPGYLTSNAYVVAQQSSPNMTVKVGSGTAKADYYVLSGTNGGQGNYVARLDVTSQNVTISAADASQTRTDEVYLVIRDNAYDSSGFALPEFGYRKGDLGGANPGADATWKASALLARITVPAAATTITTARISDQRTAGGLVGHTVNGALTTTGAVTAGTNVVGTSDVLVGSTSLPRGIIARCFRNSPTPISNASSNTTACAIMLLSASLISGRRYRIYSPSLQGSTQGSNVTMAAQLTYTVDGSTPTASSTRLAVTNGWCNSVNTVADLGELGNCYTPGSNLTIKVLVSYYTNPAALAAVYAAGDAVFELIIEDMGVDPGATGTNLV